MQFYSLYTFFFIKVSVPVKLGLIWSLQGKNIKSSAVLFLLTYVIVVFKSFFRIFNKLPST